MTVGIYAGLVLAVLGALSWRSAPWQRGDGIPRANKTDRDFRVRQRSSELSRRHFEIHRLAGPWLVAAGIALVVANVVALV